MQRLGAATAKDGQAARPTQARSGRAPPPTRFSQTRGARSPWSEGGDPAPRGGQGAAWACRPGERPSGRAIISPSSRRQPAGGDARLAAVRRDSRKGAAAGTRAGCGAAGATFASYLGRRSVKLRCSPTAGRKGARAFPGGSSAALYFSPPSLGHGPRGPVAGASSAGRDRPGFPIPPPGRDGGVPKERCPELQFDHALAQHREICER